MKIHSAPDYHTVKKGYISKRDVKSYELAVVEINERISRITDEGQKLAAAGWPRIVFYLLQFTWGLTANLAGLLAFLCCRGRFRSERFCNGIVTYLPGNRGGLSLGIFVFLSVNGTRERRRLCVHEYGHTVQCLFLGPLYWAVVVIPSAVWYHFFAGYRRKRGIPYDTLFCERWATAWGRKWSGASG